MTRGRRRRTLNPIGTRGTGVDEAAAAAPVGSLPRAVTRREATVRRALARESTKLAWAYDRILQLGEDRGDPFAPVYAAHLIRDLLNSLPSRMAAVESISRVEYVQALDRIAVAWERAPDDGSMQDAVKTELSDLIRQHQAARRADSVVTLIQAVDPSRYGVVPEAGIRHWRDLLERATAVAHAVRRQTEDLPSPDEGRLLASELTALLHGLLSPFFEAIDDLDRLLAVESPNLSDAREVAALLKTQPQFRYFFERASPAWLEPLSRLKLFFKRPPRLQPAGDGYVWTPGWPEGGYLARVAADRPVLAQKIALAVPIGDNPQVARWIVATARALSAGLGRDLVPRVDAWLGRPLVFELIALDAADLAMRLAEAGEVDAALRLYRSLLRAARRVGRRGDWHLEQLLARPLEGLVSANPDETAAALEAELLAALRSLSRWKYTAVWMPRVDQPPRYGHDRPGRLVAAVYRALLASSPGRASDAVRRFLESRHMILRRVGLSVLATRADLSDVDLAAILGAPDIWDADPETRREFRQLVWAVFPRLSARARKRLLAYVDAAVEAHEIADREAAGRNEWSRADIVALWRARIIGPVWPQLPTYWQDRIGPLPEVPVDEPQPTTVRWAGGESPVTVTELAATRPRDVVRLVETWRAPDDGFGATVEGLYRAAAEHVAGQPAAFTRLRKRLAALPAGFQARLLREIESKLEGHDRRARMAALRLVLALPGSEGRALDDEEERDRLRGVARVLQKAAELGLVAQLGSDAYERLREALHDLLHVPVSGPRVEVASVGREVGSIALSGVDGAAATAVLELCRWAYHHDRPRIRGEWLEALLAAAKTRPSLSFSATLGMHLPLLLAIDEEHAGDWIQVLFRDADPEGRDAVWRAYLVYARLWKETADLLADEYEWAIAHLSPTEDGDDPADPDEQLGQHVALADLLGVRRARTGRWLKRYLARAPESMRASVMRTVGEAAAEKNAQMEVRHRAIRLLQQRVNSNDPPPAASELRAISWAARDADRTGAILRTVVVPAMRRSGGKVDDQVGVAEAIRREASKDGRTAIEALDLLVEGDTDGALPSLAKEEIREALSVLLQSTDHEVSERARSVVNRLGARGLLDLRDLLG